MKKILNILLTLTIILTLAPSMSINVKSDMPEKPEDATWTSDGATTWWRYEEATKTMFFGGNGKY